MSQANANSTKRSRIKPKHMQRVRALRRDAPIPERILWGILRDRRLAGFKFRRQYAIDPFVVDFYCPQSKLVVELDGLSHAGRGDADERRTAFLQRRGLRVIRITNDDLIQDPHAVAEYIERQGLTDGVY